MKDHIKITFEFYDKFKNKKSLDIFHELQFKLNEYGYTSCDMT